MLKEFKFDPKDHVYTLDGRPMTGVTSVLQVIAKPALIQWAANEAIKKVKEQWIAGKIYDNSTIDKILEEARFVHRRKKEDAGSKGKDTHGEIETIIKGAIENFGGYIQGYPEIEDNEQIKKFCDWASENKVHFLASEKQVYSETHWVAGTLDFLAEINGKKFVGDIKTSNAIYGREYFAQCAAYRMMLEEMDENGFEGSVVIRLGKNGDFEEKYSYDYDTDRKLFLACLDVYRAMGTFDIKE